MTTLSLRQGPSERGGWVKDRRGNERGRKERRSGDGDGKDR